MAATRTEDGIRSRLVPITGEESEDEYSKQFARGGVVANPDGDTLTIDRALGAPYGTPENDFSKSALAHSQVLIDGEGQIAYSAPVFYDHRAGKTGPLVYTPFVDYVLAESTVAYAKNPKIQKMDHARRHFLFVRGP